MSSDTHEENVFVGGSGNDGDLYVRDSADNNRVRLIGSQGRVIADGLIQSGGDGMDGELSVKNAAGDTTVRLIGSQGRVIADGLIRSGGDGMDGDISVKNAAGDTTVRLIGSQGRVVADGLMQSGGDGMNGSLYIKNSAGTTTARLYGSTAHLYLGTDGQEGNITVRDNSGANSLHFDGNTASLYVGAQGNEGDISVRDNNGNERIRLDGATGDIRLSGADCAEFFRVSNDMPVAPGNVLVIGSVDRLTVAERAYDRRVAGVVSGAGDTQPGLLLNKELANEHGVAVALSGRVFCRVDAEQAPIEIGDLLTTSSRRGHAMKAVDPDRAFGAVLGKALAPLESGTGLIPVLVSLH